MRHIAFLILSACCLWAAVMPPPASARDAASGHASSGAAPVVSGPMECSPDLPEADRMHCENVRLDAADAALNTAYRDLLSLLDDGGRERLVEAQRAWLAFRDGDFELRTALCARQGRQGLLEQVRFMRLLTEERARGLAALAGDVRSHVPRRPPTAEAAKTPSFPDAAPVKAASDQALALLLGPHALRLHWLGEAATGTVTAGMRGRVLIMEGSQQTPEGLVRISGWVESVAKNAFVLHGEVTTRVRSLSGGAPCIRRGRMEFRRHHGRPFWRLQSHTNPCSGVTDYIDVFLSGKGEDRDG